MTKSSIEVLLGSRRRPRSCTTVNIEGSLVGSAAVGVAETASGVNLRSMSYRGVRLVLSVMGCPVVLVSALVSTDIGMELWILFGLDDDLFRVPSADFFIFIPFFPITSAYLSTSFISQ